MKTLLVLLSIIGLGCALSPNFEYTYKYSGRIGTGIPKTRSQVAGSGIEFDVVVSMTKPSEAMVKFNNIKVGEYNGDVDCDMRGMMPMTFTPLPSEYKHLEDVFHVNFLETKNKVMEIAEEEYEWMTNIRKSVVNHLRIAPLRPTMGEVEGDPATNSILSGDENHPRTFVIEEDTILGRCPSQYTIVRLPEHFEHKENYDLKHEITEDAEFGENPKEHLWRAVRSIDFDHCQDTVFLQQAGIGNASHIGHGKLNYIQSRTSISQYILRGNQNHLRLERGINEGSYTMDTYGFTSQDEEMQLITNQTMHLISVKSGNTLQAPGFKKQVDTWKYEVISPYHREGHQYNWVHFLEQGSEMPLDLVSVVTGYKMDPARIEEYKNAFIKFFEKAIDEIMANPEFHFEEPNNPFNSQSGRAAIHFYEASQIVNGLKEQQIKEVFDHFYSGASGEKGDLYKMFIVDIIAASGTRDAAKVLLEKFQQKQITGTRAATVFMTFTNNIVEPELFKDVMQFVKTLDLKSHPYFGAAAFVNFAQMAHRQCVSEHHKNYTIPTPVLGDHACTRRQVIEELLPFFKERIESAQTSWERAIYAQAIGNLGTPEVIEILRPYFYGEKDSNPRVRSTAMYALASWKLPPVVRREVFDLLMKIVDNVGEHPEVRQRAIKVLLSWQPDASWWQRLAALTWHEPSRQMQAFITSTIHTATHYDSIVTGKQTHIAKHALHLARPSTPSFRYSYNFKFSKFNRPSELLTAGELSWITNEEATFPKDIDMYFWMRLGGFDYRMFDIVVQNDGIQEPLYRFFDKLRNMVEPSGKATIKNSNAKLANEIYQKFLDAVEMENYHRYEPEGMIFTKFFDNMQQYYQLNADVFQKYLANNPSLIQQLVEGKRIHLTKYMNPVAITTAIASEVGLPVIGTTIAPTVHYAEGKIKLNVEGKTNPTFYEVATAKKVDFDVELTQKFVTKATTMLRAIVPWSKHSIMTGMDSEKQINLPIKGRFEYSRQEVDKYVKLTVTPTVGKKFPVLAARNIPFTAIKSMWKTEDSMQGKFKPIFVDLVNNKPLTHVDHKFGLGATGMDLELEWDGDVDYPFTSGDIAEFLRQPERFFTTVGGVDARQWRTALYLDPTNSKTKQINFKASIIPTGNNAGPPVNEPISVEDSNVKRYQKTRAVLHADDYEHFGAARLELAFTGAENRKYDAGLSYYREPTSTQEKSRLMFYTLRTDLPGYSSTPKSICAVVEGESPIMSKYVQLDQILKKNPHVKVHTLVNAGNANCMDGKIVDAHFELNLSEQRKTELEYELTHTSCTMNKHNNTCNDWPIDAVYDTAHAKIDFDKNMPKYLMNATYIAGDIIRGVMFPQIYYNYMDVNNQEGHIEMHAERPLESHYWKFWTQFPHKNVIVDKVQLPEIADQILPIGGVYMPVKRFNQIFLGEPVEKDRCVIYQDKVYTFDDYLFEVHALPCWTVAAHDRAHPQSWVLETREHNGHMEARITSQTRGAIVFMKEGEVKVGDKVYKPEVEEYVKDEQGNVFVHILNRDGKFVVEMPYKLTVFLHNGKIEIMSGMRYRGMMAGICGDYDGEYKFDLQGPKHCLYDTKHYETFYKSWVSEETDCPSYNDYKTEVKNFQGSCTKAYTHDYRPDMTNNYYDEQHYCKHWYYDLKQLTDKLCVSVSPVSKCNSDCKVKFQERDQMVTYKCWMTKDAPQKIKDIFKSPKEQVKPVAEQGDLFMSLSATNQLCMRK